MSDRAGTILAVASLGVALVVLLAATGPRSNLQASGVIRREGGACLQLERWSLFGWQVVGQSYTVADIRDGEWHSARVPPPCSPGIAPQIYMVRPPFDAPNGSYRLCGLADERPCLEFERVDFAPDGPGP